MSAGAWYDDASRGKDHAGFNPPSASIGHHMKLISAVSIGRLRAFASDAVTSAALAAAIVALLLVPRVAHARQIVESNCSASQTRGFDPWTTSNWFGEWPAGALAIGVSAAFDERCGAVSARGSVSWSAASFTHAFESSVGGYAEFAFVLQAGADGMRLRVAEGAGVYALRRGAYEFLAGGSVVEAGPHEEVEFFSDILPGGAACLLVVEKGEIGAAIGLGGFWEAWVVGASWTCEGTRAWGIGSGDLDCGEGVDGCDPSGGSFGLASDADSIEAALFAGPAPSSMAVRCEFLLAVDCCVSYEQYGGAYCDGFPTIDGVPLPRPANPDAACNGHFGAITLAAGWHVLEASEFDLGDGTFALAFRAGDCGPDCDANGLPDSVDIGWALLYEDMALDTDGDGMLDSCERAQGDLDLDGWIGPVDLALLLVEWGSFGAGDVDGDGTVGAADLGILLLNWRVPD